MLLVFNFDHFHIQVFLVTGGRDDNYDRLDSTEVFDPSVGSWTVTGATLRRPMSHLRATNIEGQVLIFGEEHFIRNTNIKYNIFRWP